MMKKWKQRISFVLTVSLILSLMVSGAGAEFIDQDEIKNAEAADKCMELNIVQGIDGYFRPKNRVNRAQACKMICVVLNGGKEPYSPMRTTPTFTDVRSSLANAWAEGYIDICYEKGIVSGVGHGKFAPDARVTGFQLSKMLLVALGYDADLNGYTGKNWKSSVVYDSSNAGLYRELSLDLDSPLSRDDAVQMVWNALQAEISSGETLLAHCYGEYGGGNTSNPGTGSNQPSTDRYSKDQPMSDYIGMTLDEIVDLWGSGYVSDEYPTFGADLAIYYDDLRVPAEFYFSNGTVVAVEYLSTREEARNFSLTDQLTGRESYGQMRRLGLSGRFISEDDDPNEELGWNFEETAAFYYRYNGQCEIYFSWLDENPETTPASLIFVFGGE